MSASRRPVSGSGKRALVALAMGAIVSPLAIGLTAGPASAAVDITAACPEDAFEDAGFRDIANQNEQFQLAINCLAALDVITGQTETTFNPTGPITRAQFAQFLFRLGNATDFRWDTSDSGFGDLGGVSPEARNAINALRNEGVVNGVTEDEYNPLGQVRRDQMASFLAQFYENVFGGTLPSNARDAFVDDEGSVHESNINAIAAVDVADGFSATQYGPNRPVTRAQMAAFVARLLALAVNEGLVDPPFQGGGEQPQEPTVTVGDQGNVTAGADFTGTFADLPEGATVMVSGAGLTNEAVTVGANGAFTVALPADAPTGAQTLTFTITLADGQTITVTADVTVAAAPPVVTIADNGNVTAGGNVAGTLVGEDIQSVTVSGGGLTDQTVTLDANGAFTFALPADGPTGAQTLTFTVTFADGTTTTVTAALTVAAQPSTTARPDLLTATVVSTVAPGQQTPTSPTGTTVRYTFDENVTVVGGATVGNAATAFNARLSNGTLLTGQAFAASTATTVDVLFPSVTTATGADSAEDITLATVNFNAVTDASGLANPEYDAPMGAASGGDVTLQAGITDAPDLVGAGGFRQAATAGETAVDFTFDEAAFITDAGGFRLVLTDGTVLAPVSVQPAGTPATGAGSTAGGGTVAGGNGTTLITAIFTSPTSTQNPIPPLSASAVARGYVLFGTVADEQQLDDVAATTGFQNPTIEGNENVRQAAQAAGGDTVNPDLVSIQLQPSTTGGTDRALFTFDEAIDPDPGDIAVGQFRLYNRQGGEVTPSNPVSNPANRAQVLVDLGVGGATDIVGGSVGGGAVTTVAVAPTATSPGQLARPNQVDEEGVPNTAAGAVRAPGLTALPDLVGVAINQAAADAFGNPGQFQATYTFDEDVVAAGSAVTATPASFFLYLGDGSKLRGTAVSSAVTTEDTDNTVTVTGFEVLLVDGTTVRTDDPATTTVNEAVASQDEIRAAVLGTVPAGVVTADGAGTEANPIGAERTTGGNGTRQ